MTRLSQSGLIGIILQLSVIIIVLLIQLQLVDIQTDSSGMASNFKRIDPKTLSVGIIGYTGEVGKTLTRELLKNDIFKSTVLIGRRNVNFDEDFFKKGVQKVVDFDKLSESDAAFEHLDVVYCCLGTTRAKSGADGFRKVDFDYIVESAKMAKKSGASQFHLVSSAGADKNSYFLYPKTKGESEDAISKLGFDYAAFYRPKILLGNRTESRIGEKIVIGLTKPFQYFTPTLLTTPVETVIKSMIFNTINQEESRPKIEIIDNGKIFEQGRLYEQK